MVIKNMDNSKLRIYHQDRDVTFITINETRRCNCGNGFIENMAVFVLKEKNIPELKRCIDAIYQKTIGAKE